MKWIKDEPGTNKNYVFRTVELEDILITYICHKDEPKEYNSVYEEQYRKVILDLKKDENI